MNGSVGQSKCLPKKTIQHVFHRCDSGMKGYLSNEDYKCAILMLFGFKPTKHEVNRVMGMLGAGSSTAKMDVDKFSKIIQAMAPPDEDERIRQTFLAFDTQCRRFLTEDDLQKVFVKVAPHIDKQRISQIFREIDRDCDGLVSYSDFDFTMKYNIFDT